MLGIMLRVCNIVYYLCPCCISMRMWNGNGDDLSPAACTDPDGGMCDCTGWQRCKRVNKKANYTANKVQGSEFPSSYKNQCSLCQSKHVRNPILWVPDIRNRCMRWMYLCNKHHPPDHIMKNVLGYEQLKVAIKEHTLSSFRNKRRR